MVPTCTPLPVRPLIIGFHGNNTDAGLLVRSRTNFELFSDSVYEGPRKNGCSAVSGVLLLGNGGIDAQRPGEHQPPRLAAMNIYIYVCAYMYASVYQ